MQWGPVCSSQYLPRDHPPFLLGPLQDKACELMHIDNLKLEDIACLYTLLVK